MQKLSGSPQKGSEKYCWKVNGRRHFGSFSGNFAGETENPKMHSCFCAEGMFQTEIDPWYQFQTFSVVFSLKGTGTKFTSPFRQTRVLRRAAYEAYE